MIPLLNSYLFQNKMISIPGLGSIYIERIPAQSDFVNKQLLPPSFHYRFDKYFDVPDKDFFNYIASENEIADYEAIKLYNEWAFEFRNKIGVNHAVKWEGVGTLKKDISGEIIFEPFSYASANLLPVPAVRIIRLNSQHTMLVGDKEVTNVEMSGYLQESTESTYVEKESWWIYALILAAVALIFIFFHFYKYGLTVESAGNRQTIHVK